MKYLIITLLTSTFAFNAPGQNEFAWNWHFGDGACLRFSPNNPTAVDSSEMNSIEGCVSYSDDSGNLIFYTNGGDVYGWNDGFIWNRNHQVMPNGNLFDTTGCYSAIQSSLVIPFFQDEDKYYLITLDCMESGQIPGQDYKGLRYSIIDMSLDNGMGDLTIKGEEILGDVNLRLAEGFGATKHANNESYWLIAHSENSQSENTFYVFQVSDLGVSQPIIQNVGTYVNGQMKISVDSKHIAYGTQLFDFDNSTGVISNPIDLGRSGYGKAFSPNGRFLYVSDQYDLYQFDIFAASISGSETIIHSDSTSQAEKMSLQLGPDCKIYVSQSDQNYLGVVNNPDSAAPLCNYVNNQIILPNGVFCRQGLPHYVDSDFKPCSSFTSLESKENSGSELVIYPNPSTKILNIDLKSHYINPPYELDVFDYSGRFVTRYFLTNSNNQVDVSFLQNGTYIFHFVINDHPFRKIIVIDNN